ncbi:hypothetical protein VTO42DRAFT_5910 [Malbranchea cinnamomea]
MRVSYLDLDHRLIYLAFSRHFSVYCHVLVFVCFVGAQSNHIGLMKERKQPHGESPLTAWELTPNVTVSTGTCRKRDMSRTMVVSVVIKGS